MAPNLSLAIELCIVVERIAEEHCCHVALTGGCLYKTGQRKDIDILFYRVRQVASINRMSLFRDLSEIGLETVVPVVDPKQLEQWIVKCHWRGIPVDVFFPETPNRPGTDDASYR